MYKKKFIICILATFFFFGTLGAAFAENSETSLIGTDQFSFDAPQGIDYEAAKKYHYSQEHLAVVGTEAGNWEFNFNAPETKSDRAAKNYHYDQEHLAVVGTEGGDWKFKFNNSASEVNDNGVQATAANQPNASCNGC